MSRPFTSGGQSIGASASASALPMNVRGLFPSGLGWLVWSPCSPRDSQKSPIPQFKSINCLMLGLLYGPILICIHEYWKNHSLTIRTFVCKVMSLLFNTLCRFVIAFLPRSKRLLISWLQSPSAVILEPNKIKSVTVSIVSPSICHEVMGPDGTGPWWGTKGPRLCFTAKLLLFCLAWLFSFVSAFFSLLWLYLLLGIWGKTRTLKLFYK